MLDRDFTVWPQRQGPPVRDTGYEPSGTACSIQRRLMTLRRKELGSQRQNPEPNCIRKPPDTSFTLARTQAARLAPELTVRLPSERGIIQIMRQVTFELTVALRSHRIDGVPWRDQGDGTSVSLPHSY